MDFLQTISLGFVRYVHKIVFPVKIKLFAHYAQMV